jgi:hypothetical protein
MGTLAIAVIFAALALIFVAAAVRDRMRQAGAHAAARRAWFRIALVFALVSLALVVVSIATQRTGGEP